MLYCFITCGLRDNWGVQNKQGTLMGVLTCSKCGQQFHTASVHHCGTSHLSLMAQLIIAQKQGVENPVDAVLSPYQPISCRLSVKNVNEQTENKN